MQKIVPLALTCVLSLTALSACGKKTNPLAYVSELRSNLFIAQNETLSLSVYAVEKEYPYAADGVARKTSPRVELYLSGLSGDTPCSVQFTVNGETYGGDLSYDNATAKFTYSRTLDCSKAENLPVTVAYGDSTYELNALSVRTAATVTPEKALANARRAEAERFKALERKNGFAGELRVRLIYETAPFYYVGLIDRDGKEFSMLLDGETGKILATHE